MESRQGVDYLYSSDAEKRKSNANLPGQLVYVKSSLDGHGSARDHNRAALEKNNPGFDPEHTHLDCQDKCGKWNWHDYGVPNDYNPVQVGNASYDWYSRAEAMKGSLQTVAIAQGHQAQRSIDGAGLEPNLSPLQRQGPGNTTVVMVGEAYNGAKKVGAVSSAKKLIGLGGR